MMKHNIAILSVFLVYSTSLFSAVDPLMRPDKQRINQKASEIHKQEQNGQDLRRALIGVCGSLLVYSAYQTLTKTAPLPAVDGAISLDETVRRTQHEAMWQHYQLDKQTPWHWLLDSVSHGFTGLVAQLGLFAGLAYVSGTIFPPEHNLDWYLTNNTRLQKNIGALIEHAARAHGVAGTYKEIQYAQAHPEIISLAYSHVIQDTEDVMGFMRYKTTTFEQTSTAKGNVLLEQLFDACEELHTKMQENLGINSKAVFDAAIAFQKTCAALTTTYASLERQEMLRKK